MAQFLVPRVYPGDVAMMANPSGHKRVAVRKKIEATDAILHFCSPYSPDFNPFEWAFSRLNAVLRHEGERTVSGLWELVGRPLTSSRRRMRQLLRMLRAWAEMNGDRSRYVSMNWSASAGDQALSLRKSFDYARCN